MDSRRLFALLLSALVAGCAPLTRGYEAMLLLDDIAAGAGDSALKARTPPPLRRQIQYQVDGSEYEADLYRPAGDAPARAALVLVHGLTELGNSDPRLVAFARTLARSRFNVLAPDIPGLRQLRAHPEDSVEITAALRYLARHPELTPGGRTGASAVSYAVGPLMLAALDEEGPQPDFIFAVGGYYDIVDAITFLTTGNYEVDGQYRHRAVNPRAKWSFIAAYLHRLKDKSDREVLDQIASIKRERPEADVSALAAQLDTSDGRTLYELLTNRDPRQVKVLLAQLPPDIRQEISGLDLARRDFSSLQARLILIHGADDPIVPYTHSRALAARLPRQQAQLFIVKGLHHVEVTPGLLDRWRLWRAAYALLEARDRS